MFDCSQRVALYAGLGTDNSVGGTVNPYIPGMSDPDENWFLVSCPTGVTGTDQCSWLSPVLTLSNPALSVKQYDSFHRPMSRYADNRLLWSGMSTSTFTFINANNNGEDLNNYDLYGRNLPLGSMAEFEGKANILTNTVCQNGVADVLEGDAYEWQMPSYPMAMTLAFNNVGFTTGSACGAVEDNSIFDNSVCNVEGFRATSQLPGFGSSGTYFWTSSMFARPPIVLSGDAWTFHQAEGVVAYGITLGPIIEFPVRCVSGSW